MKTGQDTSRLGRPGAFLRRLTAYDNFWIAAILLGLVVLFGFMAPPGTFLTFDNLRNVSLDASELMLLSGGMTLVIIAAGLDLSVGAVVVFSAVIGAKVMVAISTNETSFTTGVYPHLALGLAAGILAAILAGTAWGFFNGFVTEHLRVPPFIVTLGSMGMALGLAQVITDGLGVANIPPQLQTAFGTGSMFGIIPWPVVLAAVVTAVLWVLLRGTRFGVWTYAIGADREAARRAGLNVERHVLLLYVILGALAGLVGVVDLARFNTASVSAHTQDALAAIAAVVIGGTSLFGGRGRISGTIVGVLIPSVLRNGFVLLNIQPFWQNFAVGAVLILAVYADQLRRRRAENMT